MLNRDIIRLYNSLLNVIPNAAGLGAYTLVQNKLALHPHVLAMQAAEKPTDEMKSFDECRLELCRKYAKTDPETGKPMIENGNFVIYDNTAFRTEYDLLVTETGITAIKRKHDEEFQKVLAMETDVILQQVRFEQLPADIKGPDIEVFIELGLIVQEAPAMEPLKAKKQKKSKTRFQ